MKRFNRSLLVALLTPLLTLLLLNAGGARATSPTCGSWSVVKSSSPGPHYNDLYSVAAASANSIWAVGDYGTHGNFRTLTERWNGTHWSVMHSPNGGAGPNSLAAVAAVSATNIWAVGEIQDTNFVLRTLIEHWDGTSWSVVPSPNVGPNGNDLFSVAALSASAVWAVGYYVAHNHEFYRTLIEQWNGTSWRVVKSPNPGAQFDQLYGVTAVANTLWAVGYAAANGNLQKTLTAFNC